MGAIGAISGIVSGVDELEHIEEPDEIDRLEEAFDACPRSSKVTAYITRDPGAPEPQRLPPIALRRDAEAYPQIVEHVVSQADAAPGVYLVRLREGGKYRTNTRINLLFGGHTERPRDVAPQAMPLSGPAAPQATPVMPARVEPDYAREVGDQLVRQAIEQLVNPPEDDEPELEDEEDEEEEEPTLSGLAGAVFGLGKAFIESDGGKEVIGDFFSSMSAERRARARKLEAEADQIRARVPEQSKDGTDARSGLGEVLRLRVLEEPPKAADGAG